MIVLCALVVGCASLLPSAVDVPVPIYRSEYLAVDGAQPFMLTRGADRERLLFRYYNGELEYHFVVAYWDQRGAGCSFDSKDDLHRLIVSHTLPVWTP